MRLPRRLRIASSPAAVVLGVGVALALAGWGCGAKFDPPTENPAGRGVAGQGTYQMITTKDALPGIQDILLTSGGELYLLFQNNGAGSVHKYPQGLDEALSATFPGLVNPTALAGGGNHQVFVLDQGDTAAARIDTQGLGAYAADCGPVPGFQRPIADVSKYWHVRVYNYNGGPATSVFTDTTFLWVNGIAADAVGRVYVAGIQMICDVDPFDNRVRTLDSEYRIYRYQRGPSTGSVIGDNWQRDPDWVVIQGTGVGSTKDPRGMQWAFSDGAALYFSDTGNNEVQKYPDPASTALPFKIDFGGTGTDSLHLDVPIDVAVDSAGYTYVADLGHKRVLRYDPEGTFVQRVDVELDRFLNALEQPVAVAADNREVYVADRGRGEVVRYRRRD